MNRIGACIVGAMAAAMVSTSGFAADAAAGKAKSKPCAACHGSRGISGTPNTPSLAGQKDKYLVTAMKDYRSGTRPNVMMKTALDKLSDADLEDLAAYYAGLRCK